MSVRRDRAGRRFARFAAGMARRATRALGFGARFAPRRRFDVRDVRVIGPRQEPGRAAFERPVRFHVRAAVGWAGMRRIAATGWMAVRSVRGGSGGIGAAIKRVADDRRRVARVAGERAAAAVLMKGWGGGFLRGAEGWRRGMAARVADVVRRASRGTAIGRDDGGGVDRVEVERTWRAGRASGLRSWMPAARAIAGGGGLLARAAAPVGDRSAWDRRDAGAVAGWRASPAKAGAPEDADRFRSHSVTDHGRVDRAAGPDAMMVGRDEAVPRYDVARMIGDLFADEARRPPSGVTGFDGRLAPIFAGRKPGF
ncbi:MAG: hypothetical protein PHT60_13580 [Acidiphilium sp.]|nr:hypothetical protein [Acidiphilium sp.]